MTCHRANNVHLASPSQHHLKLPGRAFLLQEPQDATNESSHLQPSTLPTGSQCTQPEIVRSPIVVGVAPPGPECMQHEHKGQPEHGSQPVLSAEE